MKTKFDVYKQLFFSTLYLSAFTVGGGYVIVPLMKEKFVDKLGWVDEEEMLNMVAIAQSSPGPVAINTSLLLGFKIGGVLGAICTILGATIPPLVLISIISVFYNSFRENTFIAFTLKAMRSVVAALIINVVITMASGIGKKNKYFSYIIMILSFLAAAIFKINVIYIILAAAIIGAVKAVVDKKKIEKLKDSTRRNK